MPSKSLLILNETRAKLTVSSTIFISKLRGREGNKISIEIASSGALSPSFKVIVRKMQSDKSFSYTGSGDGMIGSVVFLKNTNESFSLTTNDGKLFDVVGSISGSLGVAAVGKVFRSSMIAFVISSTHIAGDTFVIKNNETEVYNIANIGALSSVMTNSRLVGIKTLGGVPLVTIPQTYLSGGESLPEFPPTDLIIPMAFVNYSENETSVNTLASVFTWIGTPLNGFWREQ